MSVVLVGIFCGVFVRRRKPDLAVGGVAPDLLLPHAELVVGPDPAGLGIVGLMKKVIL